MDEETFVVGLLPKSDHRYTENYVFVRIHEKRKPFSLLIIYPLIIFYNIVIIYYYYSVYHLNKLK